MSNCAIKQIFNLVAIAIPMTLLGGAASAVVPPDGTHTVSFFCGTVGEGTKGMTNFGLLLDEPYLGWLDLTQELPDDPSAPTTDWTCDATTYGCGTFHIELPGFVPPQLDGDSAPVDITGPVIAIGQTRTSYHAEVDLDNWVVDSGPAYLGVSGGAFVDILCNGCLGSGKENEVLNITPTFKDAFENLNGATAIDFFVPGIGGSLPQGNRQEVSALILRLGGACNNILPSTSSWGLVGLIGLMIGTTVLFGSRRSQNGEAAPPPAE